MYIFAARIVILADTIIFEIKEPRNVTNKLVRGVVKQRREHVSRVVCVNMYLKTVAKGERKHCPTVICCLDDLLFRCSFRMSRPMYVRLVR
jgi:hypothetical protein